MFFGMKHALINNKPKLQYYAIIELCEIWPHDPALVDYDRFSKIFLVVLIPCLRIGVVLVSKQYDPWYVTLAL